MFPAPDWTQAGTALELESYIGNGFKLRDGWLETEDDTMLVIEVPTNGPVPRWQMNVWNRTGVRAEMAKLLAMPVHEKG